MNYKLLTPGPLTTTSTVKSEMLVDHCTWDDEYKSITQDIREELLSLGNVDNDEYTAVLMQGSGTFGVESVLSSVVSPDEKLLILTNGAYGDRIIEIAEAHKINHMVYKEKNYLPINNSHVKIILEDNPDITHIIVVHSETTTGIINDIEGIGELSKIFNKKFIVDAMSSFGGIYIPISDWNIDFLVSSANKCIQGVPGFSFIIGKRKLIEDSKGISRTLSLDLYEQFKCMDMDGKWRYTSPTHTVLAFKKALDELNSEGGINARHQRYKKNNEMLIENMKNLGFATYIDEKYQGPFITSFLYPENSFFNFKDMYDYLKENGYVIYPGKLTSVDSFRIGNIGEIYPEDITKLTNIIKDYLNIDKFKNIEAIIFDWAGTTVDYGCMAPVNAFFEAFKEKGILLEEKEIREPMGMLKKDHIREIMKMDRVSSLWKEKYNRDWNEEDVNSIYDVSEIMLLKTVAKHTDIKPYVLETLTKLRNKGIKIGSTTGYTDEMMDIVTKEASSKGYTPDYWITPNSVENFGRPYPYMIFENIKYLKLSSLNNIIKIGDTISDIKEGKNAGLTTIGVLEGSSIIGLSEDSYNSLSESEKSILKDSAKAQYLEAGADYIINNLSELESLLNL